MADLTTLLSKFLNALYAGTLYSGNPTGGSAVGLPVIQAAGRVTAQTAAVAAVATYTVGAADGSFTVVGNVLATTATTYSFVTNCSYTDESNTARTISLPFRMTGDVVSGSLANTNGPVHAGMPISIRAKAATVITVATAGTFTTVTYNAEATIQQTA